MLAPHLLPPAMARQLSAHDRHTFAHSSMPAISSQLLAQASQTSAQARHVLRCMGDAPSMEFADVWQISAQLTINLKCSGATCLPPISRQYRMAIVRQMRWQSSQALMQDCIAGSIAVGFFMSLLRIKSTGSIRAGVYFLMQPPTFTSSLHRLPKTMHRFYPPLSTVVDVTKGASRWTLIYIALIVGFFAASAGLIRFCAALMDKGGRS